MIRSLIIILLCVGLAISAFLDFEFWGDSQPDSFTSKAEWACLGSIEVSYRDKPTSGLEFVTKDNHELVCLPDGGRRIWIMLEPKAAPFYKQMPSERNFSLSRGNFEKIVEQHVASETVRACLESHVD